MVAIPVKGGFGRFGIDNSSECKQSVAMPNASPALRRLRRDTGIKSGPWARRVQMHPKSYSGVEAGRRSASLEFFVRCAARLTEELGWKVNPRVLMEGGHARPGVRNATTGRASAEASETPEATEAETATEASVRRSA